LNRTRHHHSLAPAAGPESPVRRNLSQALAELDAAELAGSAARLSQALAQVADCYHAAGMASHRRWYLQQALRFAALLGAVDARVDLLCQLADAYSDDAQGEVEAGDQRKAHAARDQARDHVYQAAQLAGRSADPQWEVTVLLRLGSILDGLGDHDDAAALQRRALALIEGAAEQREAIA
jgi:tetratricopeptide (TPR) repeat protein